jgi:hypothetical protein
VKLNVAVCVKYVGPILRHVRSTQGDAYGEIGLPGNYATWWGRQAFPGAPVARSQSPRGAAIGLGAGKRSVEGVRNSRVQSPHLARRFTLASRSYLALGSPKKIRRRARNGTSRRRLSQLGP